MLDELSICIENLKLTKEQEKQMYIPRFTEMYGDPRMELNVQEPFYLNKYKDSLKQLIQIRPNYETNKDFYHDMAKMFAQVYIPLMVSEYKVKDEKLIQQLNKIALGENIKIFNDKNEVEQWVREMSNNPEAKLNGDYGAFKYENYICFTPDIESKQEEISLNQSVQNATKMLSIMIHETFHHLIDVTKKEHFNPNDLSSSTSGGSVLNEGLVEMHALDFSKKYNLIHMPALYYVNNVNMCRLFKKMLGENNFENLSFNGNYEEMIPYELLEKYKINERIRYLSRRGYEFDPNNITILEEQNSKTL